jgi:hypothetical protein
MDWWPRFMKWQAFSKRLVIRENRIIGVVMYGDTGDEPWFFDILCACMNVGVMKFPTSSAKCPIQRY